MEGCLSVAETHQALGLDALKNRTFQIFKTSATKGEGLDSAMDWLSNALQARKWFIRMNFELSAFNFSLGWGLKNLRKKNWKMTTKHYWLFVLILGTCALLYHFLFILSQFCQNYCFYYLKVIIPLLCHLSLSFRFV